MRTPQRIATRIAAVYAAAAAAWILGSSLLVISLPQPLEGFAEIAKGLLFVLVTAVILYVVIARWVEAWAAESRAVASARRELELVVETSPVGMVLLGGDGTVTFMNPAAESLLGISANGSVGRPFEDLCGEQAGPKFAVSVSELLSTGSLDGLEITGPGESTPRAVIARAARLEPQAPERGWIVALADYTQAQEQRTRSDRLVDGYRFISEMALVIGRASNANQLLAQLCELAVEVGGFKAACALARDTVTGEFMDAAAVGLEPDGGHVAARMRDAAIHHGAASGVLEDGRIAVENSLEPGGSGMWSDLAESCGLGSLVSFGIVENGKPRAIVVLFAEVPGFFTTEELRLVATLRSELGFSLDRIELEARRFETEEALARSEQDYRQLFDCNPQPMWVRDWESLKFLAVNDAAVQKYGYPREQFLTMTIEDIRPPAEVPSLLEHMNDRTWGFDDAGIWTHRDAKGREFPVHVTTHNIDWAGQQAELVMVQEIAKMR